MADPDTDDNPDEHFRGEFESLVADLNNMHQWRAEKAAEEAAAVAEQARRDRMAAAARAAKTSSDADLARRVRQLAAAEHAAAVEAEHHRAGAERRARHARRQRIEQHRAWLREQIPDVLEKSLQIQQRGGCTAHDVARLTAEVHHLSEKWGL